MFKFISSGVLIIVLVSLVSCVGSSGSPSTGSNSPDNDTPNENTENENQTNTNTSDNENENSSDPVFYPEGTVEAGSELFLDLNNACYVCHGSAGEGAAEYSKSIRSTTAAEIQAAIDAGSNHTGGEHPSFSTQNYADLEAFLAGDPPNVNTNGDSDENSNENADSSEES